MKMIPDTWITVVGIGDDGLDGLAPGAWAIVEQAEVLVGGPRHLSFLHIDGRKTITWGSPMHAGLDQLDNHQTEKVVVLASGDPNWFGIAKHMVKKFGIENVTVLPHASSFSLAAGRLGWGLQDVVTTSCHGRDVSALSKYFTPERRILTLTNDGKSPGHIANLLCERGFGSSEMAVFAHLGGESEGYYIGTAADFPPEAFPDLNVVAIEVQPEPDTRALPSVPGLRDEVYDSDGQLTKREVRAVTVAALEPFPGHVLWDIGAGAGSIGIEWLRAAPQSDAFAVEPDPKRAARCRINAETLGVPNLKVIEDTAPQGLKELPDPDAIFIGGGIASEGLAALCWDRLRPGGRLVANVVTTEGEAVIQALHQKLGGSLTRISVSRAAPVGDLTGWRPLMPVTQWQVYKSR